MTKGGEGLKKDLVSIIMPTYNRGYIIHNAIRSVLAQNYPYWELLIIDDGSTDNTASVVKGFSDKRIKYMSYTPNQGGNHARNVGLAAAQGDYFAFLDSDNVWEPNFLSGLLQELNEQSADFVFCGYRVLSDGHVIELSRFLKDFNTWDLDKQLRTLLDFNYIDTNTVLFRRICYDMQGGFDELLPRLQDWDYFLCILSSMRFRFVFYPRILVTIHRLRDSITYQSGLFTKARIMCFRKYLKLYEHYDCVVNASSKLLTEISLYGDEQGGAVACQMLTALLSAEMVEQILCQVVEDKTKMMKQKRRLLEESMTRILQSDQDELGAWLSGKGFSKIAIYGCSKLGLLCMDYLSRSKIVKVMVMIDKYVAEPIGLQIPFVRDSVALRDVDAVLVTALASYDEIKEEVRVKTGLPVIWIRDYIQQLGKQGLE